MQHRLSRLLLVPAVLLVAACADSPTAPSFSAPGSLRGSYVGEPGFVLLKKFGPAQSYNFSLGIDNDYGFFSNGNPLSVNVGEWTYVWQADNAAEPAADLLIMELLEPGTQIDSAWITPLERAPNGTLTEMANYRALITNTNQITVPDVSWNSGAYVIVYNSRVEVPPPPAGQGCTPGYWKQTQHFDSWTAPYAPTTAFSSVFANAFPGKTLLQVLSTGGGGLNALGRHTVAALLNAQSSGVNYELAAADVIARFNAAFASGNYEGQKDAFAALNERVCPLN